MVDNAPLTIFWAGSRRGPRNNERVSESKAEGGSFMSVYDILADFAYASALILVGQFLRSKVTFFQKFFIPASMLAGFLGLLLGSQFLNVIHFSDAMSSYAGLLVIPVFAIIGLNGFSKGGGKEGSKEELRRVSGNFFFRAIVFFIQFCLPIAVALTVVKALMPSISDGFGVLLASGFIGGHGTAAAVGSTLDTLGWADGTDIGMTFATIGILVGVFGGVLLIKMATRKGYTAYIKDFAYISDDMKTGLIAPEHFKSMGNDTISNVSLDTLGYHLSLVLVASGFGYLINTKLVARWLPGVPSYTVAFLVAILMFLVFRNTKVYEHVDKRINSHISGTCTDYVVFFGIASIKISVVVEYAVPILVMAAVGMFCVLFSLLVLAPLFNKKSWFERGIFCYGYATGVFAIGFVLLRIVDPENKSKTLEDTAMAPFLSFVELFVWSLVPTMLMAGQGWTVVAVASLVCVVSVIINVVTGAFYPKLPLAGRGGYDDEEDAEEAVPAAKEAAAAV